MSDALIIFVIFIVALVAERVFKWLVIRMMISQSKKAKSQYTYFTMKGNQNDPE